MHLRPDWSIFFSIRVSSQRSKEKRFKSSIITNIQKYPFLNIFLFLANNYQLLYGTLEQTLDKNKSIQNRLTHLYRNDIVRKGIKHQQECKTVRDDWNLTPRAVSDISQPTTRVRVQSLASVTVMRCTIESMYTIFSLRVDGAHRTSLIPPLFVEVPVTSQESERSYIYVCQGYRFI